MSTNIECPRCGEADERSIGLNKCGLCECEFSVVGGEPPLSIWTIYDNPKDYPGKFVARRFELDRPTGTVLVANTLIELRRQMMEWGLTRLPRAEEDDPVIVETWL